MQLYRDAFAFHKMTVGQVLLTRDDLQHRERYLHARNTMLALLDRAVVPIVNENDTVAVEELKIRIGDNDALAVSVTQLVDADALVLLTDVPGLYEKPPGEGEADVISHVAELTPELVERAAGATSAVGSGGMRSKLHAARAAGLAGIPLVVADGRREHVVRDVLAGEDVGTFFAPRAKRTSARQHWIAFGREPAGELALDDGARHALVEGKKSLLAIGIQRAQGEFQPGDTVTLVNANGREIGRGLVNFSSAEVERIRGRKSSELPDLLGYACCDTVVHRDNLVITG